MSGVPRGPEVSYEGWAGVGVNMLSLKIHRSPLVTPLGIAPLPLAPRISFRYSLHRRYVLGPRPWVALALRLLVHTLHWAFRFL